MKKLKSILLVLMFALPLFTQALEFRLSQTEKKEGWVKMQFEGEAIWVSPIIEMDSSPIASAKVERTEFYEQMKKDDEKKQLEFEEKNPGATRSSNLSEYYISLVLSTRGTALLKDITTKYCGRQLAIIHNGNVLLAATIREPIVNGKVWISDRHRTKIELEAIVTEINAGKLSIGIGSPIAEAPSHTTGRTDRVSGGSAGFKQ